MTKTNFIFRLEWTADDVETITVYAASQTQAEDYAQALGAQKVEFCGTAE